MKLAITRGKSQFGGIFRRFRELCAYCEGRHEVVGLLPLGESDAPADWPVRTLAYSQHHLAYHRLHSDSIDCVLAAGEIVIDRIARDLLIERPDAVLAVDTGFKALCVVAACRRIGLPVTTIAAGIASVEHRYQAETSGLITVTIERYCLEQSTRLIFPSRLAADYCGTRYPAMAPFSVIHNGVADAFLEATPVPDPRRIGAVMRLSGVKNPGGLVHIAARLQAHGYTLDLVTGAKPSGSHPKGLESVRFLDPTLSNGVLARFYGGCRAVAAPSWFETFGNVALEAVAVGTPAVITDRMGVGELFRELGLGHLVVPAGDMDMMVDRLIDAEPIAPAIRDRIRRDHTWQAVCERIVEAVGVGSPAF